ncbi:MAG: hypothetical protein PHV17_07540 [Candidatus Omnitrophica bacterium]|nr:hypothetical protein [Candidatus Omnitrophota bacterium]
MSLKKKPNKQKKIYWEVNLGLVLTFISAAIYYLHFHLFHDVHHILIYLIGDLGFVFLELFLVAIIFHRLLAHREKQLLIKKMNMVVGVFFTEIGTKLLERLSEADSKSSQIKDFTNLEFPQSKNKFYSLIKTVRSHQPGFSVDENLLISLKEILSEKHSFLVNLLQNPNVLEHAQFTNLLWAVFHLTEKLSCRQRLKKLSANDIAHLLIDIKRCYNLLAEEWLNYMRHLNKNYPYLFSLAMRMNPFDKNVTAEIP